MPHGNNWARSLGLPTERIDTLESCKQYALATLVGLAESCSGKETQWVGDGQLCFDTVFPKDAPQVMFRRGDTVLTIAWKYDHRPIAPAMPEEKPANSHST